MSQVYNDGRIVASEIGNELDVKGRLQEALDSGEGDSSVMGLMPAPGDQFEINGLVFRVRRVSDENEVILELEDSE